MMIVDANIATYWCVETPLTIASRKFLSRSDLRSPAFLKIEVTHALLKYLRAGAIPLSQLRNGMDGVNDAIVEFADDGNLLDAGTTLAITHSHPVYDCLYLALALERREPLATADRRMAALARSLGVDVELIEPA